MVGKLIAIEGLDGSGKHTQSLLLSDRLTLLGYQNKFISFPDYNSPSSSLVKMYLNSELGSDPRDVNAYASASFFAVDRYASYMRTWKKYYSSGSIIISDRYTTSNLVYQTAKLSPDKREGFINWIYDYEYNKLGLPKPSIVIYLNVALNLSQSLIDNRYKGTNNKKDMHESNVMFLKECESISKYVCKKENWRIVNCGTEEKMKSKQEIHEEIFKILKGGGIIES